MFGLLEYLNSKFPFDFVERCRMCWGGVFFDNNAKGDVFAVVANLIDWNNAFPRQCPKLGVESFIRNGVRPSLIPL